MRIKTIMFSPSSCNLTSLTALQKMFQQKHQTYIYIYIYREREREREREKERELEVILQ